MPWKKQRKQHAGENLAKAKHQKLAKSFNKLANEYDKYRPEYPSALLDDILATTRLTAGCRVLEIGSGTGKATRLFAERGYALTCIEPANKLLAVAKRHFNRCPNISFIPTSFENAKLNPGTYDLIIAAQSFHWVDQSVRCKKCATALKEGGWIAVFWHASPPSSSPFSVCVNKTLTSYIEGYSPISRVTYEKQILARLSELSRNSFSELQLRRYPAQTRSYPATIAEFLRRMSTWSAIAALPGKLRRALMRELTRGLSNPAIKFEWKSEVVLCMARK